MIDLEAIEAGLVNGRDDYYEPQVDIPALIAEVRELRAENEQHHDRFERMHDDLAACRSMLERVTEELEEAVRAEYGTMQDGKLVMDIHPAMQHKYDRDMSTAVEARKLIEGGTDDPT